LSQTKKGSAVEVAANLAVGYTINFTANLIILPLFGFHTLTIAKNLEIGVLFTLVSIARQYVIRRWFNGLKFFETKNAKTDT
jgi:hypothetical protein